MVEHSPKNPRKRGKNYTHNVIQHQYSVTRHWQLHSDFRGFNDGVCRVMATRITKGNANIGLKRFALSPTLWLEK